MTKKNATLKYLLFKIWKCFIETIRSKYYKYMNFRLNIKKEKIVRRKKTSTKTTQILPKILKFRYQNLE